MLVDVDDEAIVGMGYSSERALAAFSRCRCSCRLFELATRSWLSVEVVVVVPENVYVPYYHTLAPLLSSPVGLG